MRQLILSIFCSLSLIVVSQTLKGRITSTTGEAIPCVSVYIHELTSGIVSDEFGVFQTKLKEGKYTIEIRALGYESQTRIIEVTSKDVYIELALKIKIHNLNEVIITPSKEDPAYAIIRQCISRTPFHRLQVSSFQSENYQKGSVKIEDVSPLLKALVKTDQKSKMLIGKLFVLESDYAVLFQSPNIYKQQVIAYKSSIPKELQPIGGARVNTASFFDEKYGNFISPFSIHAFKYYRFKLLEVFESGKRQINKIHVTPKLKSSQLFEGDIYIVDQEWSMFSCDLIENINGIIMRLKINFQEVYPGVFLPITSESNSTINFMGLKGYSRFYSSVKYKEIKVNPKITGLSQSKFKSPVLQKTMTVKQKKAVEKLEQLLNKEKPSTVDAVKIAQLMTKVIEPKEEKEKKDSLEINDERYFHLEIDSLANKRDSAFWENIRKVPLQKEEAISYHHVDTLGISNVKSSPQGFEIRLTTENKKTNWLLGGGFEINKNFKIRYEGLLNGLMNEYNFVDGFWLGQKFSLYVDSTASITPSIYYATARKKILWNIVGTLKYEPLLCGTIRTWFGNTSEDIQGDAGTNRLWNSAYTLTDGTNTIRYFNNKYFKLENQIDISNGLRLTTGFGFESRELLSNISNFNLSGNEPKPNYPDADYALNFPKNTASTAWLKLEYTPRYKYKIINGKKEYISSDFPTIGIEYKKAIPILSNPNEANYDRLELSVQQTVKLSEFDNLKYNISYGGFINSTKLYAPDYKYFPTSALYLTFKPFESTFVLLDNYSFSNDRWLESHIRWTSDYLLLKRLPFLQTAVFNESLHLNSLWSSTLAKPYFEIGYSIGLFNIGSVGVFAGFNGYNYKSVGVSFSFPFFTFFSEK